MATRAEELILRRLRAAGGVDVTIGTTTDFSISVGGGPPVGVDLKAGHRFATLAELETIQAGSPRPVIVAVPSLPPKRRAEAEKRGISWIEYDSGLVHLRLPGLAIDLPEERPIALKDESLPSLAGKAGIIVEAVLELAQASEYVDQAEVAVLAGSTQAWTSIVFAALTKAEAMEVTGTGPNKRWRPRPPRLLQLWERDGGPVPTVTGLYVSVRSTEQLFRRLAMVTNSRERYAVGGVTAANLYEPTLSSQPTPAVWIPATTPPSRLADALGGGEVVDSGPNVICWQAPGDPAMRLAKHLGTWRSVVGAGIETLLLVSTARAVVESAKSTGRAREVSDNLRHGLFARFGWLDG